MIVIHESAIDHEFLVKATRAEIKGLIIPSINNSDLIKFLGKEIGVALTGNECIPYSLIITEGFGNFTMHPDLVTIMREANDKECFMETFTQIRAGVTRPKIILPS